MEDLVRGPILGAFLCLIIAAPVAQCGGGDENSVPIKTERFDASGGCWIVETAHFSVRSRCDVVTARSVAVAAERARSATVRKWFGAHVSDWVPRCEVSVHASGAEYAQETGLSAGLPGYSDVHEDGGRIVRRRIELNGETSALLTAVLPHEVTHIALWSEFGRSGLPRWAHEGVAVLSEPRARIDCHLNNLPAHRRDGELFSIGELIQMKGYPERHRFGPFYAQSVSLVEFLASRKGPKTVIRFLRDGKQHGYEAALRQHYAWTFAELEQHWGRHAFDSARVQATLTVE